MPDYSKPGAIRFDFRGICTTRPPDSMPEGKYPMAINVHAYLDDAITPRLPQADPLVTVVPSAAIHSLRRMNDNTGTLTPIAIGPDPVTVGADVPVGGGTAWSNPGNITGEDGSFSSVTLTSPAVPANTGPLPPAAAVNVGVGAPGTAWLNPTRVEANDNLPAATGVLNGTNNVSAWLQATRFSFSIPAGATITGITAAVKVASDTSGGAVTDFKVQLVKAGTIVGANRANGNSWNVGFAFQNYGSSSDLWGTTWSPGDINNINFGIAIKAINHNGFANHFAKIDYITLTIFYTTPTPVMSDYLRGTGFGFAVPGGSQIAGIRVEIKGQQSSATLNSLRVQLMKAGVQVGSAKEGGNLPLTNSFVAFGSALDIWGTTWTPADINDPNFGVSIQASIAGTGTWKVDYVRITIFSYSSSPVTGFVLISGAADKLYVNTTQVASGFSQNRLAMVPFRPDQSVRPWMYVGDSLKMVKVASDNTTYQQGIAEPQTVPTLALAGGGPLTGNITYAYSYRSSLTGAKSNLSPIGAGNTIAAAANSVSVTCASSTDPQADLIDIYRMDAGLLDFTYIATIPNASPTFVDNLNDAVVANNPLAEFDNFEPFPSIDTPKQGTVTVTNGPFTGTKTLTWASGDQFNVRWLPGTIVTLGTGTDSTQVTLFARPTSATVFVGLIQPSGAAIANGTYSFSIPQPQLAAQPLPAFWGPTDNAAYMFACGDPLRPGTLYFTKGNNPDSAPQSNTLEITSPSEPLIGGAIVGGLAIVLSTERGWLIYPNFAQATATIVGVVGSPFTTVETISERGLWAKEGICTDGGGNLFFIAKDGIRRSPGGTGSVSITDDIDNLFPHEGISQRPYTIAGITISPPDYTNPNAMCLRFSQGYVYFDYIGLDQTYHTLKYHVRKEAWSVEVYPSIATVHADNEGQGTVGSPALPAIGVLTGCADATVRQLSSTAATEIDTGMTILTPSIGGMIRPNKHFGDLYIESSFPDNSTSPQFAISVWTNRYSIEQPGDIVDPAVLPVPSTNRGSNILELNEGQGLFVQDLALAITGPVAPPALSADGVTIVYAALYLWEPTLIEQPETIGLRVTDWDDAGYPGAKLIQGVVVEADTGNLPKVFRLQNADDQALHDLAEFDPTIGTPFAVQSKIAFSLAVPFIGHSARLVPGDTVPWRVFSIQWVYVPIPELCREWHTEGMSHGLLGWQHIKELNIAHISTTDLLLTLTPDFGPPVNLTVPNSGGLQTKTLVIAPPFKFKIVSYGLSSDQPFRLWREDMEVKVGQWGRNDSYQILKPFGGQSAMEAQV